MKSARVALLVLSALFACSDDKASNPAGEDRENVGVQEADPSAVLDSLTVGSINMTVGWNAEDLILKDLGDSATVYTALVALHSQYQLSQPSRRMRALAVAMIAHPVDIMALQETQVMRAGDTAEFHFVDTLLAALKAQGDSTAWRVIRQSPMNQITLDVSLADGRRMDIDFWEGNAFLVRPEIQVLDTLDELFLSRVSFHILGDSVASSRGFQRIRVQTPGLGIWQLYNTHLEVEKLSLFTTMQGQALNQRVWDDWQELGDGSQIVLGDLNSKPGVSGVLSLMSPSTGLTDLWSYSQDVDPLGYTCCIPLLEDPNAFYNRRIDYVLARNFLDVPAMQRIPLFIEGFWGGDHAMLRATVRRQLHP